MRLALRTVRALSAVAALFHGWINAFTFEPTRTAAISGIGLQIKHQFTGLPYRPNNPRPRQAGTGGQICGWINGNAAIPVSCQPGRYCATARTYVGCCELQNCMGIYTTCYDRLGPACDASCQTDVSNLVCPTQTPYCAEYLYPGGSTGYGCAVATRYTLSVLLEAITSSPISPNKSSLTGVSIPKLETSSTPTPSSTTSSTTSGTTSSTTSSATTPSPTALPSSGENIKGGVIASITIGSVAIIALFCVLIFWFRYNRKRNQSQGTSGNATHMSQNPFPSPGYAPTETSMRDEDHIIQSRNVMTSLHQHAMVLVQPPTAEYCRSGWRNDRSSQGHYSGPTMPEMAASEPL